jgi:hypothetical protein
VAISDIFPLQCEEFKYATARTRDSFRQELSKKQDQVRREVNRQEFSLRFTLRDEVVNDVIRIFPCVIFRNSLNTAC